MQHALGGTVDVCSEKCRTEACGKQPSFGVAHKQTAEYCANHAPGGMVNVCHKKFRSEGCGKQPSFAVEGTKTVEYCAQPAPEVMVGVKGRKCRAEGCDKRHVGILLLVSCLWASCSGKCRNFGLVV